MKIYHLVILATDESGATNDVWSEYCAASALASTIELLNEAAAQIAPPSQWSGPALGQYVRITDAKGTLLYSTAMFHVEVLE